MAENHTLSAREDFADLLLSYTPILQGKQTPNMPLHEQIYQAMRRDGLNVDSAYILNVLNNTSEDRQ